MKSSWLNTKKFFNDQKISIMKRDQINYIRVVYYCWIHQLLLLYTYKYSKRAPAELTIFFHSISLYTTLSAQIFLVFDILATFSNTPPHSIVPLFCTFKTHPIFFILPLKIHTFSVDPKANPFFENFSNPRILESHHIGE